MTRFRLPLSFTLRTLLVVVTLLATACAWLGWQVRIVAERATMLAEIRAAGGDIDPYCRVAANEPPLPWYRHVLGDNEVGEILLPFSMLNRVDEIQKIFPESNFVTTAR